MEEWRKDQQQTLFYDVTPDWIIIYATAGGSGIGWRKGTLKKIYIGDAEFRLEKYK